jgi:cation diffusion facilitator family transporter
VTGPDRSLARFAWLSVAAAVVTIGLKSAAYALTGSVGLLSDALESLVNLVAALFTLGMLGLAARPPDEDHAWGYGKAEYLSSGAEGVLIFAAALAIGWTSAVRLLHPRPLESVGLGLGVSVVASLVNLAVARVLLAASRRYHSIALEGDARHLMTDVWTSAGVLVGVLAVALTGWQALDPLIAIAVAIQILWTGVRLVQRSAQGLLDRALPGAEQEALAAILARHEGTEVQFHALRTRQAGARRFVTLHVLVPGAWSVRRGHDLCEQLELEIAAAVPNATVMTHLEAVEDPASFEDQEPDRAPPASPRPPPSPRP